MRGLVTLAPNSKSQWADNTLGYAIGSIGAPTEPNVLLSIVDGHIKSKQTIAPTTTTSSNAGTGAISSVANATDIAGIVNLTVGTALFASGAQVTVNFNKAYNIAPIIHITAANAVTANDMASQHDIYVSSTVSGFTINFGAAPNTANRAYQWFYMVIETQ